MPLHRPPVLLFLLLLPAAEPAPQHSLPPGPPEILAGGSYDEYVVGEEEAGMLETESGSGEVESELTVEIEAFVSRSPPSAEAPAGPVLVPAPPRSPVPVGPQLAWWVVVLVVAGAGLTCCLCCYLTHCLYLTVDCCSDPYWGCLGCLAPWALPCKPPPHLHPALAQSSQHSAHHSRFSLGENSAQPRRSAEPALQPGEVEPLTARESEAGDADQLADRLGDTTLASAEQFSVNTLSSVTTSTLPGPGKSVRNYKRARPASHYTGEKRTGLSESLPHVYEDGEKGGLYFSFLHLLGRNKRRYKVATRNKSGPNNNTYRQSRYRHIADSRNSAAIPTKISKRASTASSYGRPVHYCGSKRSRSVETVGSAAEVAGPVLQGARSERHLAAGRSRLSANLAQLEARPRTRSGRSSGRSTPTPGPTAPLLPEYNLRYFERSLLKSKETTL